MSYIIANDYVPKITDRILQQITEGNQDVIDEAEATAIAMVTDHLAERYDTDLIFSKVDSDRNLNVVRWVVNLMIYYIYERIADKMVPPRVIKNYDDTIADLKEIEKGEKSAVLPRLLSDDLSTKTKFRWGSNTQNTQATI